MKPDIGMIPFQMKILEIQLAITKMRNPLNGFWYRRNRIKNIGAANAAIGNIHLPLEKNRKTKPNKKYK